MRSPDKDAPKPIRELLLRWGGMNPYGKPNWRVCLAQHVLVKRGGVFHNLEDVKSMFVLGPDGKRYAKQISDRVTSGFLEVPRYPHKGWVMERWQPAHVWGTKELWENEKSEDGTPMMGPFPVQGDYFMVCGPFTKMPDWSDMECAVAQWESQDRNRPADLAMAIGQAIRDEADEQDKKREAFEAELEYMRTNELLPILKGTSLEAQRYRNQLSEAVGDRSQFHVL